jgi:hypothetical protein
MRWLTRPLIVLAVALTATSLPAHEGDTAGHLARARAEMVERTREYRASLEHLLAIQEARATSAGDAAATRRRLYEQGIVSRLELEASERAEATARDQIGETRRRLSEAESVLAETLAAVELAGVASAATTVVVTPMAIGSRGDAELTATAVRALDRFFVSRFARSLPVSALGQTPVHDRLGLDHRNALDVAVHPDSEEGRALIEYLERHGIPFLAFRGFVPGASTGAHVHVGRVSVRIAPASSLIR